MKLSVSFGDEATFVVDWDKEVSFFNHYFYLNDKYWQWVAWDVATDLAAVADYSLIYGHINESAIPYDGMGKRFPTPDFKYMFNISSAQIKVCECGAEKTYGKNTGHATWCPLWSKN